MGAEDCALCDGWQASLRARSVRPQTAIGRAASRPVAPVAATRGLGVSGRAPVIVQAGPNPRTGANASFFVRRLVRRAAKASLGAIVSDTSVRERDGLEARAHTHGAKELANVVANGLLAQLQLVRNLAGGAALRRCRRTSVWRGVSRGSEGGGNSADSSEN